MAIRGLVLALVLALVEGQSTLKLSATLTIERSDDKEKTNEQILELLSHAKQMKYEGNVQRFLENMVNQMQKVLETAKVVEEKKSTEIPKDFTPPKYRAPQPSACENKAKTCIRTALFLPFEHACYTVKPNKT